MFSYHIPSSNPAPWSLDWEERIISILFIFPFPVGSCRIYYTFLYTWSTKMWKCARREKEKKVFGLSLEIICISPHHKNFNIELPMTSANRNMCWHTSKTNWTRLKLSFAVTTTAMLYIFLLDMKYCVAAMAMFYVHSCILPLS